MKIGILGGTFDPIHNAHVEIAKSALSQFELDKVWIMPTPFPPHKDKNKITSNFHRTNMIKLAIGEYENIEFSDFEINMSHVTYTADTLHTLNEIYPENEYYFIIGSDSVASFLSWYRPDIIIKNANLITVARDDESMAHMGEYVKAIEDKFDTKIGIIKMDAMEVSSSFVRIHEYEEIKDCVPEKVYKYIVDNNLYRDAVVNKAWSVSKITEDLRSLLKKSRFEHTLGVANTAKTMAEAFGENPNRAYLAGILHDCAKNIEDEKLLEICQKNGIEISIYEKTSPYLLHGKVGAFIANTKYNITDEEILSSVIWHTTGKEDMTTLEKIIFSADYIEPGRYKQKNLDYLREISHKDLDLLVFTILEDTMEFLSEDTSKEIDINTVNAYNYYKELISNRN